MNGTFCVHILGSNNINRCPKSQLPMDCLLLPWLSEMKKKRPKKFIYYLPKFCQEIKKIYWRYEVNIHFAQFPNTFLNTQVCGVFFSPMQETVPYKNDDIFHIFDLGPKCNVGNIKHLLKDLGNCQNNVLHYFFK